MSQAEKGTEGVRRSERNKKGMDGSQIPLPPKSVEQRCRDVNIYTM